MRVAICLFALLAAASAMELANIHAEPLGKTLLMSIRTSLDGGSTIDEVSNFLASMLAKAQKYCHRVEVDYKINKGALENDIKSQKELIANFQDIIAKLQNTITTKSAEKDRKEKTLVEVSRNLKETKEQLAALVAEHAKVAPELKKDVEASVEAEKACREAIATMETYQTAVASSLLQVATNSQSRIQMFSQQLESLKPHLIRKNIEISAIVHELIALTATPKDDKIAKVQKLLSELHDVIRKEVADSKAARQAEQENYEKLSKQLKMTIQELEQRKAALENRIETLGKQITAAQKELVIQNANLKDAQEELASLQTRLAKVEAIYKYESTKCDKEVAIMQALINHFDSNVKTVSNYAKNAAQTGKGN